MSTLAIQHLTASNSAQDNWRAMPTRRLAGVSGVGLTFMIQLIVGYKTEGCNGDENWCFKSAVGKSLPSSFHSYPARDRPRARSLLPATSSHQHRFAAPQERRQEYLSTSDNARQKGYADGKRAALTFASDGSKLGEVVLLHSADLQGFTGQFMNDALSALGSSIMSTDAQSYRQGFRG